MAIGVEFPAVLAAARTGAEWAWELLFESVARPLRAYARARGSTDPDDLCGEVLLRVVRDLHGFSGDEARFCDPGSSPSRTIASWTSAGGWDRRLAALHPDQRQVLLLRVVAGLDTEEVARVLDKRIGHVRVLQHRALRALRAQLEDHVTR